MPKQSELELDFLAWLGEEGIAAPVSELAFAPPRKWRFDFAWPTHWLAVEIEGGLYRGGRHQSLKGFVADAEKYETALRLGWRVYRVPGPWVTKRRPEVITTLRRLLGGLL